MISTGPDRFRDGVSFSPEDGPIRLEGDRTSEDTALQAARRVLEIEIAGLRALSHELDSSFVRTIDLLERVTGRIVVTGMGKSGHVAHKISSTLASTGAPSHYVHPAEASHGDLGMITKDDAVIALSNSGETGIV